jgi:hypothetical protein
MTLGQRRLRPGAAVAMEPTEVNTNRSALVLGGGMALDGLA